MEQDRRSSQRTASKEKTKNRLFILALMHVIPTVPVGAPADEYSAVVPLPVTVPAEAE